MPLTLSVVICSFNRLECLRDNVPAIIAQLPAVPHAELVVVDDGSKDGSAAWLAAQPPAPNVKVLRQSNYGLSAARNRGWEAAHGDWIAYLDDDAVPEPGWLAAAWQACQMAPPRVAVIGGPIRLQWPGPVPPWLPPELHEWLTCLDLPAGTRDSNTEPLFRGANMICRRTALASVGGFSERLGRKGTLLLSREECDLAQRLGAAGFVSRYDPTPGVFHRVHPARLSPRWFFRRLYWEGLSLQIGDSHLRQLSPLRCRARALLYVAKKILPLGDVAALLRFHRPQDQMMALSRTSFHLGFARGIWNAGNSR